MLHFDDSQGSFELVAGLEDGIRTAYSPVPEMEGWLIGERAQPSVAESGRAAINWDAPVLQRPLDGDDASADRRRPSASGEAQQTEETGFGPFRILELYRRVIGE
jgi:hypothetical protein